MAGHVARAFEYVVITDAVPRTAVHPANAFIVVQLAARRVTLRHWVHGKETEVGHGRWAGVHWFGHPSPVCSIAPASAFVQ